MDSAVSEAAAVAEPSVTAETTAAPAAPARTAAGIPAQPTAAGLISGSGTGTSPGSGPDPEDGARDWQLDHSRAPVATKVVVAGGFGVGKTTFVRAISEITPLQTEALMTQASEETDDLTATPDKLTTTVAMDFGRITLDDDLVLYVFGTPGQQRFWFMWDDLIRGAIGAIVLADTRRLTDCFPALDYFESCGLPYLVAVNHFEGTERYAVSDVREALTVPERVPVVIMDARKRYSVVETLLAMVEHSLQAAPE
ncbi:ATP/GTP-binding protein [Streptomyces laurentii]|uniref:ATP/GTP-binding protein n=1 Tax=Streptomyces laurentii TaxID=39478 RepID=A0A160P590_STRLU|nr:ATP/GTP-binding protein [Streptomyces laurentii]